MAIEHKGLRRICRSAPLAPIAFRAIARWLLSCSFGSHQVMVERAILGYLLLHPDAADAPEGIRQWWIPGDLTEGEVTTALDHLVRARWLTVSVRRDSTLLYSLNKERASELRSYLHG